MPPLPSSAAAPAPSDPTCPDGGDSWHGRARALARHGLQTLTLGVVIAVFLWLLTRGSFTVMLVYSWCISVACWLLIDGGRLAAARWRLTRDPADEAARRGWPGWAWMSACVVLGGFGGYLLGSLVGDAVTGLRSFSGGRTGWRSLAFFGLMTVLIGVVTSYYFYARGRMEAYALEVEQTRRVAAETQLRLLEAQLEPHMLFNTLANLRVLITLDPPRAQALLDRIIDFLRATLSASRVALHPLSAEFRRLEDYLALMQVRMGERLHPALDLPEGLGGHAVPPLLLQPLVENAIKHGLEARPGSGLLRVSAGTEAPAAPGRPATLVLRVEDDGAGLPDPDRPLTPAPRRSETVAGTGFGLTQVRERLATLYGEAASLQVAPRDGGGVVCTVRLPLSS